MSALTVVSVLFLAATVFFSCILLHPGRPRASQRSLEVAGRSATGAFGRAVGHSRFGGDDDGQMLVVVGGRGDDIADDVAKVHSDDDSV